MNIFDDENINNDDNIVINLIYDILLRYIERFNISNIDADIKENIIIDYIREIYYEDNIYIYIKKYNDMIKDFLSYYIYSMR